MRSDHIVPDGDQIDAELIEAGEDIDERWDPTFPVSLDGLPLIGIQF
jgi:hypothetical protein